MATAVVLLCFALYAAGYLLYSRWLGARVFSLRPRTTTPAHSLEDGVDYVPSRRGVLFGHHYASITGLSPMLGPAIAVIWGWVPALLWVALGAVLIGCVHDFGSLVVSARAEGKSIGVVAERLMGRRAKALMHAL
ncbi:MAG: carbon starvation protein A, partial [Planctomycetota bacterium]